MDHIVYRGYTIEFIADQDAESPREWDNLGKMICFHGRYNLGDKHDLPLEKAKVLEKSPDVISLPLYLYDHSGLWISTTPFSCPWDSGKIGFIYATKESVRREFDCKKITKELRVKVQERLKGEVKLYDEWQRGESHGYVVKNPQGEEIASCWGFFNSDRQHSESEAKREIDHDIDKNLKVSAEQFAINSFPVSLEA